MNKPLPPSEAEAHERFLSEAARALREPRGEEMTKQPAPLLPQERSGDARELLAWLYERAAEQDEGWAADNQPVEQGGPGSSGCPMPRNFYFEAARAIEAALSLPQDRPEGARDWRPASELISRISGALILLRDSQEDPDGERVSVDFRALYDVLTCVPDLLTATANAPIDEGVVERAGAAMMHGEPGRHLSQEFTDEEIRNFARAALTALGSQDRSAPDEGPAKVLIDKGYALERRALSYATGIPAANALLADLGEYARQAAEALASRSAPDGWVLEARRALEVIAGRDAAANGLTDFAAYLVDSLAECARQALAAAPPALSGEGVDNG